jgi:hypothetical protein
MSAPGPKAGPPMRPLSLATSPQGKTCPGRSANPYGRPVQVDVNDLAQRLVVHAVQSPVRSPAAYRRVLATPASTHLRTSEAIHRTAVVELIGLGGRQLRLLYTPAPMCSEETLKRLMLVGNQLDFMDRPSVTLGDAGTIGIASPMRQLNTKGEPVTVQVYAPPSGPASQLYERYIEADLRNSAFISTVLEGLRDSESFASMILQREANYGDGLTGSDIRTALIAAIPALGAPLELRTDREPFQVDSIDSCRNTLAFIIFDLSVQITSALAVSAHTGAQPVADERHFSRLMATRTQGDVYGVTPNFAAPFLGLAFAKAVIPDEVLQRLSLGEIINYRRKSVGSYTAWSAEIDRVAADLDDISPSEALKKIPNIIRTELTPKLVEFQNDMEDVRDELFGELIKSVTKWEIPTLSVACLSGQSFTNAILAFCAAVVGGSTGPIVDYVSSRRSIARKHSVSYLLGISRQ